MSDTSSKETFQKKCTCGRQDEQMDSCPHCRNAGPVTLDVKTPWQVCPRCNSDGTVIGPPASSLDLFPAYIDCPVCFGEKLISSFNGLPPSRAGHEAVTWHVPTQDDRELTYFIMHMVGEEEVSGMHLLSQSELENDKELWPLLKDLVKKVKRYNWATFEDPREQWKDKWQFVIVKF